jgi:hypothetical protein
LKELFEENSINLSLSETTSQFAEIQELLLKIYETDRVDFKSAPFLTPRFFMTAFGANFNHDAFAEEISKANRNKYQEEIKEVNYLEFPEEKVRNFTIQIGWLGNRKFVYYGEGNIQTENNSGVVVFQDGEAHYGYWGKLNSWVRIIRPSHGYLQRKIIDGESTDMILGQNVVYDDEGEELFFILQLIALRIG